MRQLLETRGSVENNCREILANAVNQSFTRYRDTTRKRARHLKKELASGRGGINRLDHAVESDLPAVKRVQQGDQVAQGTT
jgi:hypothetical protein